MVAAYDVDTASPGDAIWSVEGKGGRWKGKGRDGRGGKGRGKNVEFHHLLVSNLTTA